MRIAWRNAPRTTRGLSEARRKKLVEREKTSADDVITAGVSDRACAQSRFQRRDRAQ